MAIILITGWLGLVAVCVLYYRQPWRARARVSVLWLFAAYRPRHGAPAPDAGQSAMARWEYGVIGVDVCAHCAAPMREGGCPRCGWTAPPDHAPWPRLTDARRAELAAGLETARAIAAEPRPGAVVLPAPTDDISGAGGRAVRPAEPTAGAWLAGYAALAPSADPEPPGAALAAAEPEPPPGGESGTLRLGPPPGIVAWLERDDPAEDDGPEPPPPEPLLPPSGDWAPGTGPPEDDEPEPEPEGRRWAPSRRATPADAEHARDLARQDADAAEFIDAMDRERRRYLWQLRRGFLAQRGLAF